MELTLSRLNAGVAVLVVDGRVDAHTWEHFSAMLLRCAQQVTPGGLVLLDVSRMVTFSSRGLRAVTLAYREYRPRKVRLAICGANDVVREIFEISRYDATLRLFPSVEAARAELDPSG